MPPRKPRSDVRTPSPPIKEGDGSPEPMKPALSPEAIRALAEAQARRQAQSNAAVPQEVNGPQGLEPTRYGDWERKGLISDF